MKSHARERFGKPPLPAGAGFALQPIDEVDDGVEATPGAAADAGPRNSYAQMRLAGAGSADQHSIALFFESLLSTAQIRCCTRGTPGR